MPLRNTPLFPIDETNYNLKQERYNNIPLTTPEFDPLGFKVQPGQMVMSDTKALKIPEQDKAPGFFDTFGHAVMQYNELSNLGRFGALTIDSINHLDDYVPEDFKPNTVEAVEGFPQTYWPHIWDAVSPKDQEARKARILEQMKDEQHYSNGSMIANLTGGLVGGITSPSTWFIPMAAGIKYANFGQNIIRNTIKAAPAMAASTVATEGLVQAGKAGGNLQDMALDSIRDFAFGSALIAGGVGLGSTLRGGQLWDLRKTINQTWKGVDINPTINDKGEFTGFKATANPKMAASAKEVDEAQFYIDSTMKQSGLFKLPYLNKIAGNSLLGSPIVRGLSSPYIATRGFINRMASHGIITEGVSKGIARENSAEDYLSIFRAQATAFSTQYRGLYYAANGLIPKDSAINAIKDLRQTLTQGKQFTYEQFGKEVRNVIYTGESHPDAHINEAANLTKEFIEHIGKQFTDAHGWEEGFLPPRTALNYLMQNYNLNEIRARPEEFIKLVVNGYKEQDAVIERLITPVREAQEDLRQLQAAMKELPEVETRALANEISDAKGRLKRERDALVKELQDNPDNHILLEDRVILNSDESEQLKSLLEKRNELESEIQKQKNVLDDVKKERASVEQLIQKNKTDTTRKKNKARLKEIEKKLNFQESTIARLENDLSEERLRLTEKASAGEINRKFYYRIPDSMEIGFRDPNELPKLRKPFESDGDRESHAKALRETILGNTAEDLNAQVLGNMMPGAIEAPSYLKKRSVLLPSKLFNNADFLDPDISKAVFAYTNTMGRYTALKKAFIGDQATPGIEGILKTLKKEKDKKENIILEEPESPARRKKLNKHQREYDKEVAYIKNIYDAFMGRTGNPQAKKAAQTLRNLAAATMLGGVPITQLTDLGAIVLKQGLLPFFMQGLAPQFKSINGLLKTKQSQAIRENAAHAHVALQHVSAGYSNKFLNADSMSDIPAYGRIGSAIDRLAHVSGNLYGTNYIENLNQTITANIFQSRVMKAAFDFKDGKLKAREKQILASYGIDIEKWADRFIENYKEAQGWSEFGGYQSKYYNWKDAEAVNRMSDSIYRAVYDTVVQRGMFSSPLWTNNPIGSLLFTFHGWAYSAFSRYTIPMMQRPDAQAAIGIATMFGLGLLVEPMRKYANGKQVDFENTNKLLFAAIDNSGVLSAWSDMFNTVNLMMNQQLVPGMASERRREISRIGALAGPIGSEFEIMMNLMTNFWTGKISQQDLKQGARLIPLANHLLLRRHLNNFISSTDLPERSSGAEPWPWWQQ